MLLTSPRWKDILEKIPAAVLQVIKELKSHDYQAYLVGGSPRNLLLGQNPQDWDVATDALPECIENLFHRTTPLGKEFGTILVHLEEWHIEVTTFRREGAYSDGRHPDEVDFIPRIEEDLARRDFTINSIALDPISKRLVDPFNGRKDLGKRIVRAVGIPRERFAEDPLRMLRFFRFQSALDFRGHRQTFAAVEPGLIKVVSPQRIQFEFNELLLGPRPDRGLQGMAKTGLLETMAPEFKTLEDVPKVLEHLIKSTQAVKPDLHLRWAAFLHDLGKGATMKRTAKGVQFHGHHKASVEMAREILERLGMPRSRKEKILHLINWHMFECDPRFSYSALRRLIKKVGPENIEDLLELRRADIIASTERFDLAWKNFSLFRERIKDILAEERVFSLKDLAIDGHDVQKQLQISPGPQVGEILEEVMDWVLEDPRRNNREELLEYLQENFKNQ